MFSGGGKRQKELSRMEKRDAKMQRLQRQREEATKRKSERESGIDPDIAGIVPGPQPPDEGEG